MAFRCVTQLMSSSPFSFLSSIYGKNILELDRPFKMFSAYFGQDIEQLTPLGKYAGRELYELAEHVDKRARPELIMWGIDGTRVDRAWLDPSEKSSLERLVVDFGVNRYPYGQNNWFLHFASIYLISDPGIACVLTVTNQTAYAIHKYGNAEQKKLIPSLTGTSEDIRWGATWFTELQGGSDLGSNSVGAEFRNGTWYISGTTKYFSSDAGLADYALVSARRTGGGAGAKGLSLFLVPEFDSSGSRNFTVRRLKDKSGTASVPTGEVEFHNSSATAIGEPDKGIYYIMEDLMVSRLSNAFGALGTARKAYLEAYFYSMKREAFGRKLIDHPLVRRDLMEMEIYLEGTLLLTLLSVDAFQKSWQDTPPYTEKYHMARLLTHVSKNLTADMASFVTQMAMELHGGVGFLREFPIERLHREALITPIWEGPSNIQALDMLESMQKKGSHLPLLKTLDKMGKDISENSDTYQKAVSSIKSAISRTERMSSEDAQFFAKDLLNAIGHGTVVVLLLHAGNLRKDARLVSMAALYYTKFVERKTYGLIDPKVCDSIIRIDGVE